MSPGRARGRAAGHVLGRGARAKRALLAHEGLDVARQEELARGGFRLVGSKASHVFCYPSCARARTIERTEEIRSRPTSVDCTPGMTGRRVARHVIGVGSGKGGVGKTTTALNLALGLRERGRTVGVLDADLHGPNLPLMVGITRHAWTQEWTLARRGGMRIEPIERYGLKIVSAGFILGEDQPLQVPGMTVRSMLVQLLQQTEWGELDYLVIDLPPGTGDVQQALLRETAVDHAIAVVTPQYVAHLDARKAVRMYRAAKVPVLGGIENMGPLRCPHCGEPIDVFPAVPADRSLWSMDVELIGSVPLDPLLSRAGDSGRTIFADGASPARADAFRAIAGRVEELLGEG